MRVIPNMTPGAKKGNHNREARIFEMTVGLDCGTARTRMLGSRASPHKMEAATTGCQMEFQRPGPDAAIAPGSCDQVLGASTVAPAGTIALMKHRATVISPEHATNIPPSCRRTKAGGNSAPRYGHWTSPRWRNSTKAVGSRIRGNPSSNALPGW